MKSISLTIVAAAALPVLAAADGAFWSDAPSCAQSCVSSAFSSSSDWPSPTAFCGTGGPAIASCLSAGCGTATASVASSFSSISSSLCSLYSSCSAAGSTGVVTVTATGGSWGGYSGGGWGGDGDGSHSGPWGASGTNWPSNGATTTFTVSGCGAFATGGGWGGWGGNGGHGGQGGDGDGWGGGSWGGDGVWGNHGGFWGTSQKGWAYRTATTPLTTTYSTQGAFVTATGIATVEEAVSGSQTSTTTFFALNAEVSSTGTGSSPSTSGSSSNSAAGNEGWTAVKIAGLALGTLMVVVGML